MTRQQTEFVTKNIDIQIPHNSNYHCVDIADISGLALRINPKRAHLIVSDVLGKHIPANPFLISFAGRLLGLQVNEKLHQRPRNSVFDEKFAAYIRGSEKTNLESMLGVLDYVRENNDCIVIGYAETATSLGALVAQQLNAPYIHSTRYPVSHTHTYGEFEESHSHAPGHFISLYDDSFLSNSKSIVLVDDELSTGNTALNTIRMLHDLYPHSSYVIAALIDGRTQKDIAKMTEVASKLKTTINVVSLSQGVIQHSQESITLAQPLLENIPDLTEHYTGAANACAQKKVIMPAHLTSLSVGVQDVLRFTPVDDIVNSLPTNFNKTLVLGIEEFLYLPLQVANSLRKRGEEVYFSSTTRSPVAVLKEDTYAIQDGIVYHVEPTDEADTGKRFAYNVHSFERFVIVVPDNMSTQILEPLINELSVFAKEIIMIELESAQPLYGPDFGSYDAQDVTWLLKDLSSVQLEAATEDREEAIQSGGAHYSESLPIEYQPGEQYQKLFEQALVQNSDKVAYAVGMVSEKIRFARNNNIVLVSLARAGTPVGVLIKHWFKKYYALDVPHYAVSIVRGKGIDANALNYLAAHHNPADIIFIDGWTGKGAITKELRDALIEYAQATGIVFPADVAVLADPGSCVDIYGTRDDFLIPSACLNSTVSGLISRTVHNDEVIGEHDFHGAKFYKELTDADVSKKFIEAIESRFADADNSLIDSDVFSSDAPTWDGWKSVEEVSQKYGINNVNLIKPGVGETTRVLLRRVPWKIIIRRDAVEDLAHIVHLAKERNVDIDIVEELPYSCMGLIHPNFTKGATGADGKSAAE